MDDNQRVRYPALRQRNFVLLWTGLLVSNTGTWMQNVAQAWLIYKMTGNDPLYLGWLGLAFAIPMVVLPPIGGVVADRVHRVRLLYVTQSSALALAGVLAVLTWMHALRPWHILSATFLGAVLLAFDNPARQSLVADLVPRDALQNALSLNSATFTGAALVGPALAGTLIDVIGAGWLFMLNAISFLAVIFALAAMKAVPVHQHRIPPIREAMFGGLAYTRRERWLQWLLIVSAVGAVFGRSYQQLLPAFADGVFHGGARGYGALLAAGGAGALIGALGISALRDIRDKGRWMIVAGIAMSVALIAFSLVTRLGPGVALAVVAGISATVFTTMIATMIQLRVPHALRGRVISLYVSTLIGLPSLGSLGVAAVAKSLREGAVADWARPLRALLAAVGVVQRTRDLGVSSGAPRAVILGAAVVALTLLLAAPFFLRENDAAIEAGQESESKSARPS